MALYSIQGETLGEIADAIREQTGTEEPIQTSEMSSMIRGIEGGSPNAVLFTEQSLTDEQKAQARENIGAAAIGEGGSSENAVLYIEQDLTSEQKNQARKNIDIHVGEEPADADEGAVWIDPDSVGLILGNAIMAEDTNDGDVEIFGSLISEDTVIAKDENSDGNIILQTYISEEEKTGINKSLQSITFPGLPDTYTVPSKAEDISAASLEYARQIGNPRNLLDNSDFTNPVNQRDMTVSSNGFIIDRWYAFDGEVTISADGITTTENGYLQQRLPSGTIKPEKTYTLAVYYSDGTFDINTNGEYASIADFDLVNYIKSNGKIITSVALYEGEYTAETLPKYQPKGYAAELLECQRYFLNITQSSTITLFTAMAYSTTTAYVNIPTPIKMRLDNPTISYKNMALRNGQTDTSITGTGDPQTYGNSIYVRLEVASGLTSGKFYQIRLNSGALSFSADL